MGHVILSAIYGTGFSPPLSRYFNKKQKTLYTFKMIVPSFFDIN